MTENRAFPTVRFLRADDWVGIYVDGELRRESHSIQEEDAVQCVTGQKPQTVWTFNEEFWDSGSCPTTWNEVENKMARLGIKSEY